MKQVYISHHQEDLCRKLAEKLNEPKADIFQKEIIVTPSAGMNAWLKTELPRRNGVIANFGFQNQDGLFRDICELYYGTKMPVSGENMKHLLFSLLAEDEFVSTFTEVSSYYNDSEIFRYQLAGKTADLFDQYQLYRPEMLQAWRNDKTVTANKAEEWQKWLWNHLGIIPKEETKTGLLTLIGENPEKLRQQYPHISFFGITVYTRFHLEFFGAIAAFTSVDFYLCLPVAGKDFRNGLLEYYGFKARELMEMFPLQNAEIIEYPDKNSKHDTLLGQLQQAITSNYDISFSNTDDSLQVNSCFTPAREAECLYNFLLHSFDNDRTLKPADVLVVTPDIDTYAPFIRAVFSNAPVKIPFRISGEKRKNEDSVASALELILNFSDEDFTSEKVVSLLEHKRIRQKYGIDDCSFIRTVVNRANIRFGMENRSEDDSLYVSWKYGLEKILLGYAMLTDEAVPSKEYPGEVMLYPFPDAEASRSYDLFRLKAFVEQLQKVVSGKKVRRSLSEWKKFLFDEVTGQMIFTDDAEPDDRAELASLYSALRFTGKQAEDNPVSFPVFLEELKAEVFNASGEFRLNTGNVTVSPPVPVRGIPFRIICFIGLNNDAFPRKDSFMGFDLLGEAYKAGDRNKKETDKYLFLDTLMAAGEKFYISYTGAGANNNTEIPPSIVVDTLLDYTGRDEILVKHPLHGFSRQYNNPAHNRLFTYLYAGKPTSFIEKETEPKEITEIRLRDFIRFFQAPVDWYFNTILNIYYQEQEEPLPETELFEPDHLQRWALKKKYLDMTDDEWQQYIQKAVMEGELPLKTSAVVTAKQIMEEMSLLASAYRRETNGRTPTVCYIDYTAGRVRITGDVDGLFERDYISCSVSRSPLKNKTEAFITSLLLTAAGKANTARFIDVRGIVKEIPVSKATAEKQLAGLAAILLQGSISPILFTLKSAEELNRCQPVNADEPTMRRILDVIKKEAYPPPRCEIPANPYLLRLMEEGAAENFGVREFEMIRDITAKLKLFDF